MIDEVSSFIKRRFPQDCSWTSGNCFWFATILLMRFFPDLVMWYLPITNHWIVGDKDKTMFFDWTGYIPPDKLPEEPVVWPAGVGDKLEIARLYRDCIQ